MISFGASVVIWSIALIFVAGWLVHDAHLVVPGIIALLLGSASLGTIYAALTRLASK